MYTYVQRRGCKKENTTTYVHTGRVSNAYSRIHTWLGRNGETASSSCSWGANQLGRNGMRGRVHREGLDGIGDGNEVWRTTQWRKQTSYVRNGVLLIGRGVAYRKTEETDLLRSKRGTC